MRCLFTLLFFLTCLFPPALFAAEPAAERAILEVVVNGHNEGQQFLRVTPDGDVLLPPALLEGLRLRPELWAGQGGEQISLRKLTPKLQFSLDQNSALLHLAVPPQWFKPQVIGKEKPFVPAEEKEPLRPLPWAGFLNYSIQADFTEQDSLTGMNLPWELGLNHNQWLLLTTFNSRYDDAKQTNTTLRQKTSLLWDAPDTLRSLTLGDFDPPYNLLTGGGNFAGISWRKNFHLDRNFRYASDMSLETMIDSPTHARLYSNGQQIKEWDLLPGAVNFEDISSYVGGDAELVLTDAFGREQRLSVPSFTSQEVLKKGLHEYAYSLGWQRENLGQESNDYGDPVGLGFHRYGFGETWTGGAAFAVAEDGLAAGPMLAALVGGSGQIETGLLVTRNEAEEFGGMATARCSWRYKEFNAYAGLTGYSREYTAVPVTQYLEEDEQNNKLRYQGSLSLSYSDNLLGGLSASYAENEAWNDEKSRSLSLTYRKPFSNGLHLSLGVKHDLDKEDSDSIYLTLQYTPNSGSSSRDWYDSLSAESRYHQTDGWENSASLQKTYPRGAGYGYTAGLSEKEGKVAADAHGEYKNARGIYTASVRHTKGADTSGSLSAAGSLALLDSRIYQGRPVTDSFAVVKVEGLESVTVENGSSPSGTTGQDSWGLLVPDLSSYNKNRLSIATLNLPLNYNAAILEQTVEVQQRSGSLVNFQFTRFSAVEGELYVLGKGDEKVKLEAMPLEFTVNGEKHEAFTGREGYFYLENIPLGEHELRVRRAEGDCTVKMTVPDSAKIVVNLGSLACAAEDSAPSSNSH